MVFTAEAAHELCNLLTVIEMCSGTIDAAIDVADPGREALAMLEQAARRASELARDRLMGPVPSTRKRTPIAPPPRPDPAPRPSARRPSSPMP